jgi:hypothetical protein
MIGFGLLVLLVIVAIAGVSGLQSLRHAKALESEMSRFGEAHVEVPKTPRRIPLVAEALGYVGGMLAIVGLVLLISHYWSDMANPARVSLTFGGSALLIVGGYMIDEIADVAFARLRWFMWLLASAALGVGAAVVDDIVWTHFHAERRALLVSASIALLGAVLWAGRRRPVQQFEFMVALLVAAGTGASQFGGGSVIGLTVWVVAVSLLFMGVTEVSVDPVVTVLVGAVGSIVGASLTVSAWNGFAFLFVLGTGVALGAVAIWSGAMELDSVGLAIGVAAVLSFFESVPASITYYSHQAAVVTGCVVTAVALAILVLVDAVESRVRVIGQIVGGSFLLVGAALMGRQNVGLATLVGLALAVGMIALGVSPGHAMLSLFGLIGLLVFVPWTIAHYFPGSGSAPLLILVSGALIVVSAVVLARMRGRFTDELHSTPTKSLKSSGAHRWR